MNMSRSSGSSTDAGSPLFHRNLPEELSLVLASALRQIEQLGRPHSRRAREAQRRAMEFVESALQTSQMLQSTQVAEAPVALVAPATARPARRADEQHELLGYLRQLAPKLDMQLGQEELPDLPRIVSRTLAEVVHKLLTQAGSCAGGLQIESQPHGVSLKLRGDQLAGIGLQSSPKALAELSSRVALVGGRLVTGDGLDLGLMAWLMWPAGSDDASAELGRLR